ncbi:uncharacterized protein LOC116209673 isoform X1 [Punica granatum]|uniref:Uncharacterized protein LOC116209673 isoform X1 n=2 Tax=Punica granatum TaxID=22663 RepID=A0A6P8E2Y2_PUNGR|nr:uncharacterized protein LOC116209673 isoform X1 [Punica granatum]PKI75592.1 hypothetical protein CRG98_003993 [Punica granatum]
MDGGGSSFPHQSLRQDSAVGPIWGMESVVATVSGYHGTERFNLIKLISRAGASYVGAMSSSTTHLICWNFEGKKYDLAKKFRTIVVNHQWIEDCIRQGTRVSELPFMMKSGQETGPLVTQVPIDTEAGIKKRKALSDRSNFIPNSISTGGVSGVAKVSEESWTDSILLKQEIFTSFYDHMEQLRFAILLTVYSLCQKQKEPIHSSRRLKGKKTTSSTHEEFDFHSSLHSTRKENYLGHEDRSSPFPESSRRGRRLVKKNIIRETLTFASSDSEEDCHIIEPGNLEKTASLSDLAGVGNLEKPATGITADTTPSGHQEISDVGLEGTDEVENCNQESASRDVSVNSSSATVGITPEDESHHVQNLTAGTQDTNQTNCAAKLPATTDLSCVICWTEFSSTRGVLPCGHRFCFTCIREWANNMASRKRISTCPLCKTSFMSITIVEDAACSDQKIYSQTIPLAQSATDIYVLADQQTSTSTVQLYREPVCVECQSREPADLLISCDVCKNLCIHSYCLDPPLEPWTCVRCRDSRISHYWPR